MPSPSGTEKNESEPHRRGRPRAMMPSLENQSVSRRRVKGDSYF